MRARLGTSERTASSWSAPPSPRCPGRAARRKSGGIDQSFDRRPYRYKVGDGKGIVTDDDVKVTCKSCRRTAGLEAERV
jgi:hypothetical protein